MGIIKEMGGGPGGPPGGVRGGGGEGEGRLTSTASDKRNAEFINLSL